MTNYIKKEKRRRRNRLPISYQSVVPSRKGGKKHHNWQSVTLHVPSRPHSSFYPLAVPFPFPSMMLNACFCSAGPKFASQLGGAIPVCSLIVLSSGGKLCKRLRIGAVESVDASAPVFQTVILGWSPLIAAAFARASFSYVLFWSIMYWMSLQGDSSVEVWMTKENRTYCGKTK